MTTESRRSYQAAAARSGVVVRELTELTELHEASVVLGAIWGAPDKPPMNAELLRALAKAESYVAAAYDGATMVGVCVGFHSAPAARAMHSHIAGVTSGCGRPPRGIRAEAAPACVVPGPGHHPDGVDVRPAGRTQRLLQPEQARGDGRGVPPRLLRRDGRRHQPLRRERPDPGPLAAGGRGRGRRDAQGRRCALSYRPVQPRPGWPCPPTSRRCGLSTSTRPGAGA